MKRRLRTFSWSDALYDVSIVLLYGEWAPALAWMDKTYGNVTEQDVGGGHGAKTMWMRRDKGVALVLWFPRWFSTKDYTHLSVLAHESFHAAEFLLRERGMTLTDSSDEAYAYYIAWMFRECYKRLNS